MPLKVMSVVGARPNFIKLAPLAEAIDAHNRTATGNLPLIDHCLVHTGQHYDEQLSQTFFKALDIPKPDIDLGIGSGTHAEQVGHTMIAFERIVRERRPDWIVVVGDVNATCACSITAKKEHVRLAHIEAGLRSFDLDMPEEINRMVTDRLSDLLLTPDWMADENLRNEGCKPGRIACVGNIMIDTLDKQRAHAHALDIGNIIASHRLLDRDATVGRKQPPPADGPFMLLTLHRPSNVDDPEVLTQLVDCFCAELASRAHLVWTIHPRTRKQLEAFGLWKRVCNTPGVVLLEPVGYHEMLRLNEGARLMLTDSGGLQEECCITGTPCVTLRFNTERPITLRENGGVSLLAGNEPNRILACVDAVWGTAKQAHRPALWDGHTAERVVDAILESGHRSA
jgi:UDP-N-acetylglucosamine 2-epimerase (non-hydrolysing)